MVRCLLLASVALLGCGPKTKPLAPATVITSSADAPYELANDDDLAAVRDDFHARVGAERSKLQRTLATEYVRRSRAALEGGDRQGSMEAFRQFLSLFDTGELAKSNAALATAQVLAHALRAEFAASGGDIETTTTLYLLAALEPAKAGRYTGEIDDIFAFGDELAVAEYGEGAERSRPIAILEQVVRYAPFPAASRRLIKLYRARHHAIERIVRAGELNYEIIGAHGQGVLRTVWHLVRVHALAGTLDQAVAAIDGIVGFGDDPELREAVGKALAPNATGEAWVQLARSFDHEAVDADENAERDLDAALAILEAGARRLPADRTIKRAAGHLAAKASRTLLAIRLLEDGVGSPPSDRKSAQELAELYEFRVTRLALGERPNAARTALGNFERFYAQASGVWDDFVPDLANAYAAMGRGLISLGDLEQAEKLLSQSLKTRPTLEALEHLGTMALRQDRFEDAAVYFARALEQPAADPSVRFNHNKLLRLAGEALWGAGHRDRAYGIYLRALDEWQKMRSSTTYQLRPPFAAEALVESGKLLWHLGKKDTALAAFAAAQDLAPSDSTTYAAVVSFLVVRDRYDAALDAYHRALGSRGVSDYFKVYMSLWILAESRRAGKTIDPFVRDFLAGRDGSLWYDDLARFASGRTKLGPLQKRANTRARRAELLYYKAVLGNDSASPKHRARLLRDVVASDMVMFFEYEMAKHWLESGFAPR